MTLAERYRRALLAEFAPHLRGDIVEIGAGIGQNTPHLLQLPAVRQVVSVEPDPEFCAVFRRTYPALTLVEGTAADLRADRPWDALISINVLEHIRDDEAELLRYRELLAAAHGCLCLFVPARQEIYAPLDRDFGHHRRYSRPELAAKLAAAGFAARRLHYFNLAGYFGWWLNFCLLKKRSFSRLAIRLFDSIIFPPLHAVEKHVIRPPLGQSLIAVAEAR